jgi:hypothetical protein
MVYFAPQQFKAARVSCGPFSSDRPAPDALGMSASLRSSSNLRTAAIRRGAPGPDSCTAVNKIVHSITSSTRAGSVLGMVRLDENFEQRTNQFVGTSDSGMLMPISR